MKLRLIQPGQPDVRVDVAGDSAIVGRAPDCDLIVEQSHISKHHVQVLAGLVAVDLQSSNGTFLNDERLSPAGIVAGRTLRLGPGELYLEVAHETEPAAPSENSLEIEALRRRSDELTHELEEQKRRGQTLREEATHELETERERCQDLERRLKSLKGELEQREADHAASLETKLTEDQFAQLRTRNEELERELTTLRASATEATAEQGMRGELEALRVLKTEQETRIRELEGQAEAPASDLFFQLQGQVRTLKQRIAELESAGPVQESDAPEAGAAPASELLFELQAENQALREQLAESSRAAPGPATMEAAVPRPLPASPIRDEEGSLGVLRSIVVSDIEGRPPLLSQPAEEFLTLESFRFLRQVEKIVTRMAGDFIQLYQLRTVLPDMEGTLRGLLGEILDSPNESEPREDLMEYIEEMRKWLVVSLGAHRQAAERFAEQLKNDLGERNLTAQAPLPAYKKIAVLGDAELWKRASAYLKKLTPDYIDDRLEKLAREAAQGLLHSPAGEPTGSPLN